MWQCSQHVLTTRDKSCRRPNRKSSTTATTSLNHHRPPPHLHLHQEAINSSPFRKWRLVSFCALPCQQSSALFSPLNSVRPHHPCNIYHLPHDPFDTFSLAQTHAQTHAQNSTPFNNQLRLCSRWPYVVPSFRFCRVDDDDNVNIWF